MGEKRMYVLVVYNISDIQKGIQAAHAIAEYGFEHKFCPKYKDWIENHKTIIVLNGGTTNSSSQKENIGTLQKIILDLRKLNIDHNVFVEPDLNNAETAVAFLIDMDEDSHVYGYLRYKNLA
jgi:hypothetical protein